MKMKRRPIMRKGDRCRVLGNDDRTGTILGRFQGVYVVSLDKPYIFGRKYRTAISTILVHPDNCFQIDI